MTNTSTMDTRACVEQIKRIVDAGGDYVRLTTQGVKEAENLREINIALRTEGYMTPLVADVHFNARVADVASLYAEKVRVNPGNYVDTARTFKHLTYTDDEYRQEIEKIRRRFAPFLRLCAENHTAIRIGVNHGSLSDRIMSHYGDTPAGMVESCMEFLRVCQEERFTDVVISIKASNTVVMVRTVRLLCDTMAKEGMAFPLHLGVTEAGEGEDGRVKSALGIGALLADGIGDTIRVSLSEPPEAEIPVARKLVDYIARRQGHPYVPGVAAPDFDYLAPERRDTTPVRDIGGGQVPVVIARREDGRMECDPRFKPDYIYVEGLLPPTRDPGMNYIVDSPAWQPDEPGTWPAFMYSQWEELKATRADMKFLFMPYIAFTDDILDELAEHPEVVLVAQSNHPNRLGEHRALAHELMTRGLRNPIVVFQHYQEDEAEDLQIKAAADMGPLIFDGLCDGIFLINLGSLDRLVTDATAFAILQAGRLRTSKTEYISCPGCGRTLFDLQRTIARVKAATTDLKGLKIAVMGCIVNGPGEMADADYGYVGAGRGKVSLYKGKTCVEKNIPEEEAVERLLAFIRQTEQAGN
jgi:(E)-4-hydroxy-3-methylbut-2-enyl-diphosphate synthase